MKHLVAALLGALAMALLWGGYERGQHTGWRDYAKRLETASQAAAEDLAAANHLPAAKSKPIAEKSNAEAPAYYRAVHAAADRHAVRVRAEAGGGGSADMPGTDSVQQGVHGPAEPAELVCRPAVEDSQIVGAAARAAEMHQEALDLIAEGVAVALE